MDCDAKEHSTLTHKNANKKSQIDAVWVAPNNASILKNGIRFHFSVVEEKDRFWVNDYTGIIINNGQRASYSIALFSILIIIGTLFQF